MIPFHQEGPNTKAHKTANTILMVERVLDAYGYGQYLGRVLNRIRTEAQGSGDYFTQAVREFLNSSYVFCTEEDYNKFSTNVLQMAVDLEHEDTAWN